MKRFFVVFIFLMCSFCYTAYAQVYPVVLSESSAPVNTQVPNARYEFIQSTLNKSQAFLLDKNSGRVWRYKIGGKRFEEINREEPDSVDMSRVNFQLYISGENSSMCFLLNIHTGQIWRYGSNNGEKTFKKLDMPHLK